MACTVSPFTRRSFHGPALRGPQHRPHYDHHVEPNRLDLLFLPIRFLMPNLAFAAGLSRSYSGSRLLVRVAPGEMLPILHYEWVHYVADIPYQARTQLGHWIKQYHVRHHFISAKHWFGVSNPALDGCSARVADPQPAKKAPRPAISIREEDSSGRGQPQSCLRAAGFWPCCGVLRGAESKSLDAACERCMASPGASDPPSALLSSFEAPASRRVSGPVAQLDRATVS